MYKKVEHLFTAYKDAPYDYRNIADEVNSLHIIIEDAAQHFESTTLSNKKQKRGKKVLEGCQNVLKDLDALIEKYNALASANTSQVFRRIKLGTEDIATLRARLISNTTLLDSFIQRLDIVTIIITISITIIMTITIEYIMLISQLSCKSDEIRAQLDKLVLRRTSSRSSLVSFAGSINTQNVYRNLCKGLFKSGVTAKMIKSKEEEIYNLLKPSNATTNSQIEVSINAGQSQLPEGGNSSDSETLAPLPTISTESNQNRLRFPRVLPPVDFLVGPLMVDAAKAGDIKRLKSTLRYVRDINFKDDTGATALHNAASGGIAQLLLSKGASIEATDKDNNNTPLHHAAWNGHTSTVELLLSKGASIEATNIENDTPLHLAALRGHTSTVDLLLSKGASIEATTKDNYTPLHYAAQDGHTSIVELLLAKGASIEATGKYNHTPLHHAALHGRTSTVELLLSKGASIEVTNKHNTTPLHLAAQYGNTRTVELLLSKGASIEVTNEYNNAQLQFAAQFGHTSIVELLLSKGASIEATNKYNNTPLHYAAWKGSTSTVELLLSKGASTEATNKYNYTPLHYAARHGHTSIVELLLSQGGSIEATNKDNSTPLHLAALYGHTSIVELLLSKGASIEATNNDNYTPLHLAARESYMGIVTLLKRAEVTSSLETYETVSGGNG